MGLPALRGSATTQKFPETETQPPITVLVDIRMDVLANSKEQILAEIRADKSALHFNVFSFANYSKAQPRNFCKGSSKKLWETQTLSTKWSWISKSYHSTLAQGLSFDNTDPTIFSYLHGSTAGQIKGTSSRVNSRGSPKPNLPN
jgi:hypothetical protein